MPDRSERQLVDQLRAWADDLEKQVPPHLIAGAVDSDRRARRPQVWAVAGAVACLLAASLVWLARSARDDDAVVAGGATLEVVYERVEYTQTADITCPEGALARTGDYDEAIMETWGDVTGMRFRTRVTYPDGSTTDVVAHGLPWYPDALWVRGRPKGAAYACDGFGTLLADTSGQDAGSLNPMVPIPTTADLPGGAPDGMPERPLVQGYRVIGTKVDAATEDSLGRPAERWEHRIDGGSYSDGPVSAPTGRINQVEVWFVDGRTGAVLQQDFQQTTEHVGTVSHRLLLTESGTRVVQADHFDTSGYERREGHPLEDIVGGGSSATTTVDTAPPPTCPVLPEGSPRVSQYAVGHLPAGFLPQPIVTTPGAIPDPAPEAEPSRSALPLVHPDGRQIDVVVLVGDEPAAALALEHHGAEVEETSVLRCYETETGDRMTSVPGQLSVDGDRIVVGTGEWEYGSIAVVGSAGASLDDVLAVMSGLRLVSD